MRLSRTASMWCILLASYAAAVFPPHRRREGQASQQKVLQVVGRKKEVADLQRFYRILESGLTSVGLHTHFAPPVAQGQVELLPVVDGSPEDVPGRTGQTLR